jgi:hypothetical protein
MYRFISEAPLYAMGNKMSVKNSMRAGCYNCLTIFDSKEIKEYCDGNTCVCPRCGADTVLPSSFRRLTIPLLRAIHEYWLKDS